MTESLHRCIAGVDYVVAVPRWVSAAPPDPFYAAFASSRPPAGDVIRIGLVAGEIPDLNAWRVLLSSGPAWSIRQHGAQRCLCVGGTSTAQGARLAACWAVDASCATVYCGPEYLAGQPNGTQIGNPVSYPVDQLLLIYYLASRQGLLVHAAGLVAEGRTLLFPGVSGGGKSTLARQFLAHDDSTLLSDDRIVVRFLDGAHQAYGTPWPGDVRVAVNASAPLGAILFPAQGAETRIRALSPQAALDRLLPATSILWHEAELLTSQLKACERLLCDVPAYELVWSPKTGVVDQVREFVRQL